MHQFKGDVTFGAWLKRIVINTCLDTIKGKKLETESLEEERTVALEVVHEDTNWEVDDGTTATEIVTAIDKLPINYKSVVKLFLLEGYDHYEISGILSISENVSRTNLHRGKKILKETLKHLQYGTGY